MINTNWSDLVKKLSKEDLTDDEIVLLAGYMHQSQDVGRISESWAAIQRKPNSLFKIHSYIKWLMVGLARSAACHDSDNLSDGPATYCDTFPGSE